MEELNAEELERVRVWVLHELYKTSYPSPSNPENHGLPAPQNQLASVSTLGPNNGKGGSLVSCACGAVRQERQEVDST